MGNFESHTGYVFGLNLDILKIDTAYVFLKNNISRNVYFYILTDQCDRCLPKLVQEDAIHGENSSIIISTKYGLDLFAGVDRTGNNLTKCLNEDSFLEFGIYNCSVSSVESMLKCFCIEAKAGVNIYWPILFCVSFYFGLATFWIAIKYLWRRYRRHLNKARDLYHLQQVVMKDLSSNDQSSIPSISVIVEAPKQTKRVQSIDTFRGIAITLMIFVNYGGGDYWFIDHAPWNGLHIADLVFPWFLWLMGVCIPISTRSLLRRSSSKSHVFLKILKRSIYLFILGLAISNATVPGDVQNLRILGVLQRFGITYFVIASLHLAFLKLNDLSIPKEGNIIKDFVEILPQWLIVLTLVSIHLMITLMFRFQDCPRGYLGPGGRHNAGLYENCTAGISGYVDRLVLGSKHLYQNPSMEGIFDARLPHDPEGILSTLQALFSVFLGTQAGMIILTYRNHTGRIVRWLVWAIIIGFIGGFLSMFSRNDGWIPVNKNLWSVSYVLVTASLAFIILALCYYLIDVLNIWNGSPFFYPGMNSILLYVGHELTSTMFPWRLMDSSIGWTRSTHGYRLVADLWATTMWILISFWLYKINFFLKL